MLVRSRGNSTELAECQDEHSHRQAHFCTGTFVGQGIWTGQLFFLHNEIREDLPFPHRGFLTCNNRAVNLLAFDQE